MFRWPITRAIRRRKAGSGWRVSEDRNGARRRIEQSAEHFERRGLAGAVRTKKADDLPGLDPKLDSIHGAALEGLTVPETAEGA